MVDGPGSPRAVREAVDPRHRHHVARNEGLEHFENLAPVVVRAGYLLAVNLGASDAAQLLKLAVERLAHGADAGIAEKAVLRVHSGHDLREA